jgi:hypothetical protein
VLAGFQQAVMLIENSNPCSAILSVVRMMNRATLIVESALEVKEFPVHSLRKAITAKAVKLRDGKVCHPHLAADQVWMTFN